MKPEYQKLYHALHIGPLWLPRAITEPDAAAVEAMSEEDAAACSAPHLADAGQILLPPAELDWPALTQRVAACQACALCQSRVHTVFGTGDLRGRVLFVGEGPGFHENQQGQPFVGPAGRLLDQMLRALGYARDQGVYIANVMKCRPSDEQGKDRPPSVEEVAQCLPFLQRQIQLLQPGVIIALGKTAATALLGLAEDTSVGRLRGIVHRYQSIPVVVTYHPAYLLRQPQEKAKTWADLCLARRAL